jgi:hypothetical protein
MRHVGREQIVVKIIFFVFLCSQVLAGQRIGHGCGSKDSKRTFFIRLHEFLHESGGLWSV